MTTTRQQSQRRDDLVIRKRVVPDRLLDTLWRDGEMDGIHQASPPFPTFTSFGYILTPHIDVTNGSVMRDGGNVGDDYATCFIHAPIHKHKVTGVRCVAVHQTVPGQSRQFTPCQIK